MTSTMKLWVAVIAVAIIALVGAQVPSFGGTTNYDAVDVSDGYAVDGTTVIDGSGNLAITGTATFDTTTLYVDPTNNRVGLGTSTPQTRVEIVESNATTTIYARNASTTSATGARIILEDTDGAGCTQVTVLNGTVIGATVTCP